MHISICMIVVVFVHMYSHGQSYVLRLSFGAFLAIFALFVNVAVRFQVYLLFLLLQLLFMYPLVVVVVIYCMYSCCSLHHILHFASHFTSAHFAREHLRASFSIMMKSKHSYPCNNCSYLPHFFICMYVCFSPYILTFTSRCKLSFVDCRRR